MGDVRSEIKKTEPELDIELVQVLQDMINDLSNAPEPIQIKLFSPDPKLLDEVAPRVADEISKIPGVVSVENGIENTISGPATNFQVDPVLAARLSGRNRHAAACVCLRIGIANVAAAGDRSDWGPGSIHDTEPGGHSSDLLLAHAR